MGRLYTPSENQEKPPSPYAIPYTELSLTLIYIQYTVTEWGYRSEDLGCTQVASQA